MKWRAHWSVSVVARHGLIVVLGGCAGALGLGGSAEQIRELTKDKNAACTRLDLVTPWGTQRLTSVNVDKGLVLARGGGARISGATCDTDISHEPPAPAGVAIAPDCRITATSATLAEITRLAGEVPGCAR